MLIHEVDSEARGVVVEEIKPVDAEIRKVWALDRCVGKTACIEAENFGDHITLWGWARKPEQPRNAVQCVLSVDLTLDQAIEFGEALIRFAKQAAAR